MKILIVTQYFWPENFRINDLALSLMEKGAEVTILTGLPNYPLGKVFPGYGFFRPIRENYKGIKIIRSPLVARGKKNWCKLFLNYLSFAISASIIGPIFCNEKYDRIFVYEISPITVGIPAIVMKYLKRAPIYFWIADLWPDTLLAVSPIKSRFLLKVINVLVKFIYDHSDHILVTSQGFIPKIIQDQHVKYEKIKYWPQWAEEFYRKEDLSICQQEELELPKGLRLIFAGNIGSAQAIDIIIDVAEMLKDFANIQWIIFGEGSEKGKLIKKVKKLKLEKNVHFMGQRPAEQMSRYFALADALLLTLKKDNLFALTVPGKIQSYLACAKPIIAAIDGEGRNILDVNQCGFTCEAENVHALSSLVKEFYNTPQIIREEMGNRGFEFCRQQFNKELLLNKLLSWMA